MTDWPAILDELTGTMMHRALTPEEQHQFERACEHVERGAEPAVQFGDWAVERPVLRVVKGRAA